MLARLGSWCYRKPWSVLGIWLAVLVAVAGGAGVLGGPRYLDSFDLPDSDSSSGIDVLSDRFSGAAGSGFEGTIVFQSAVEVTDPSVREPMEKLFAYIDGLDEFVVSSPYAPGVEDFQISEDRHTAFAQLTIDPDTDFNGLAEFGKQIREQLPRIKGTEIAIGGAALAEFEPPKSELIGLAFAIIVLIVAFGSVLAMGLPIAVALAGVGLGAIVVTVASHVTDIPEMSTIIGTMIGLGVGIDYALFIVTRYREQLHIGHSGSEAAAIAIDTAGRAVLFAGMTVVISLLGMLAIGLSFVGGMGVSAAITVAVTMAASVTLLPALLGFAKYRVELTRLRGLVAAGFVALGLLGVGLNLDRSVWLTAFAIAAVVLVSGRFIGPLRREIKPRARKPANQTLSYRWSHFIQRHPWLSMTSGAVALLIMAIPVLSMRVGSADEGNFPEDTDPRRAYDMLADGFGPGFTGPLIVAVEGTNLVQATGIAARLEETEGVAKVVGPIPSNMEELAASGLGAFLGGGGDGADASREGFWSDDPDELLTLDVSDIVNSELGAALPEGAEKLLAPEAIMFQVLPDTSPQSTETVELIDRIRNEVVPDIVAVAPDTVMHVTGNTAVNVDFSTYLSGRTPMFFGIVLALSFLLLMAVFRSILVPLKAVIMNLLSIGAAYGVVVAIFQWGWLSDVFGVEPAPIEPFLPVMLFAIVFGLSMDYEVFLLSRIKEEYDRTGHARNSVADGLAATARVISAAAAIMVVVFGSFLFEDDRIVKSFGLGLAVAVFLDASLVRMLLVPATMELLGAKNWWFPRWLDRIIPTLNVEGTADHVEETDPGVAITAETWRD